MLIVVLIFPHYVDLIYLEGGCKAHPISSLNLEDTHFHFHQFFKEMFLC